MRKLFARVSMIALLAAAVSAATTAPALAGGALETLDITAGTPSPIPGQIVAKLVRIFWDPRTIPIKYRMNSTLDPIPNPLGAPFLSRAAAQAELQNGFNAWNAIPTSYIDMRISGTVANPGTRGFDMINELTFRTTAGFTAIASSPSVSLIADENLTNGTDLDGDGDSDVSSAITTSNDVDGDGDIEMPAGFYKAGTILENDIQFNTKTTNGFRFTVDPAAADTNTRSVDLLCVAIHEEGHSHGLSHVLDNQISATDGSATTMYPFIDTGDPAAELTQRTLGTDDIAWSSYFYPEGTANSGPPSLQAGDVPFKLVYGLIKGSVQHGEFNEPVAGASVSATNAIGNTFFSAGFSGTTQVSYDPNTGEIFLVDPAFNIINGNYVVPVKLGLWKVGLEATDGFPVSSASISLTAQIGDLFGQQNFNEEFWDGPLERAVELQPGLAIPVPVIPSQTVSNIDLVTNAQTEIANFGSLDFVGFTGSAPGTYYAVRIPASDIAAFHPGQLIQIQEGLFHTFVLDASVVPVYAEATLAKGTVSGSTASIDLAHPLAKTNGFIGQDNDFAPFYFPAPLLLGGVVRAGIQSGNIQNLFLVLRIPTTTPFPGVSGLPPLIGLDGGVAANDAPIFGYSYTSTDGVTFNQVTNFNFRFALVLAEKP